jgi:cytochrome c oxidase assembly factor CtaG
MIVAGIAATVTVYVWGLWRAQRARRPIGIAPIVAFALAIVTLAGVLIGPMDALSDASLSWHMVQHMTLIDVVAPLLVLAAPVRLLLAVLPVRPASRVARAFASAPLRWAFNPAFAWLQLAAVLYGVHFSPLYEAALENEGVHAAEHLLFLGSGIIFWTPLLAVAPAPHAPSYPVRILSVFLALPMSAFLGFAFYVARHPMYPHYAKLPGALADQMNAGAVMWIAGGAPLFAALLWLVAEWGARERRYGAVFDGTS